MRVASRVGWFVLTCLVLVPESTYAQAAIAGMVKDASGAVLPGVTVEASSPALIEKSRSVVTDGTGQYKIVDLRPGTYTVTFALPGFTTVRREGVELTGSFTATINTDMRVGTVEETVTVTGEAPTVDVQSATRQRVLDHSVMDAIPSGRNPFALAVLIPGVSSNSQDVGGSENINAASSLAVHGGRNTDQIIRQNGVNTNAMSSAAYSSRLTINLAAVQELAVDTSAVSAEEPSGGVRINLIPREGGNTFSGTLIGNFANSAMQGTNFTQELKDRGLSTPGSIRKNWDINPGLGGPLRQDRLWFYASGRSQGAHNYVPGMFANRNANNPNLWAYVADASQPASNDSTFNGGDVRLTWQATQKNKIGFTVNYQANCSCPGSITASTAPEADLRQEFPLQRRLVLDWSSPITNRVLFEAGANHLYGVSVRNPSPGLNPEMITVTDQSNGLKYRANDAYRWNPTKAVRVRAAVSYITGAHAVKVGFNHNHGYEFQTNFDTQPVSYRFNNGVPNQITLRAFPFSTETDINHDVGVFAQDSWKVSRLTLSYGVRYDHFGNGFPEQHLGPAPLTPTRDITFPARSNVSWNDVTPRLGAAYDVFGNGKTALKVSFNKYLENMATNGVASSPNPTNNLVTSTTRSWNDNTFAAGDLRRGNFVPDCDLLNPASNGECGGLANSNFGKTIPGATFDPDLLHGWGKRNNNWEFTAGVQHEILPRVSVDVSYFRRWYGNFVVTDDRTVGPADFDRFSITAPADTRLPGGGRYVISGLYNLNPTKFGQPATNFVTRAENYGRQIEHWNGMDFTLSARPRTGLLFQGGVSGGRTSKDTCEILANLPETNLVGIPYCHVETLFLTRVSGLAAYTIPKIAVQVSGTVQSLPGPEILANYNAPNAVVAPSLDRPLSGGAANVTVNLVAPGTMYGERLNQLDLRVGRVFQFGRTRASVNLDLYNSLNVNTALTQNNNFAAWQVPQSILAARFAKIGVQVDF